MAKDDGFGLREKVGMETQKIGEPPRKANKKKVAGNEQPFEKFIMFLQHRLVIAAALIQA
jgi:hypothetical protein